MPRGGTTRVRAIAMRVAAGLAFGAILTVTFLRVINLTAVYQQLRHLNLTFALLSGVVFLSAYVMRAVRWRQLLRPCQVTVGRTILIYQIATFLNWLLPVQGGELAKAMLLRRSDGIPVSRSLATVSMDKTMDLLPVLGLLILMPFAGLDLSGLLWTVLLLILGLLGLAVAAVGLAAWRRDRTVAMLGRRLAGALPTPPAHLGFTELVALLVFSGLFGVSPTGVAAMFIFFHPFTGLLLAGAGLFGLSRLGLSLRGALRLTTSGPDDPAARAGGGPAE